MHLYRYFIAGIKQYTVSVYYFRYLHVHFKLITFDNYKSHPAHFKKLVTASSNVRSLLEIVRSETSLQSPKSLHQLILFKDKSYELTSQLPEELTLEECGYMGGPKGRPEHVDLYYDYKIEFRDCPLLMSDHYFGQETKSKNKAMRDNILQGLGHRVVLEETDSAPALVF